MKFFGMSIWTAVQELRRSFLRAVLSLFSVAIGITSLVVSQGVAAGVFSAMQEYIRETGGLQLLRVFDRELAEGRSTKPKYWRPLALEDCAVLQKHLPQDTVIAPEVGFGVLQFQHRGRTVGSMLVGGTPTYAEVNAQRVIAGRMLTEHDVVYQSKVVVISFEVLRGLFSAPESALGADVLIAGMPFKVVGVFDEHVLQIGAVKESKVINNRFNLIPISVAQGFGGHSSNNVTGIHIKTADVSSITAMEALVERTLVATRGGMADFLVQSREAEIEGWKRQEKGTRRGLFLLSVLTLIAGGVGIINVMLASVEERTKEIGIRRAIGASRAHIGIQFVIEAAILSLVGGVTGVAGAFVALPLVDRMFTNEFPGHPVLLPAAVLLGLACSVVVGVLAGVYPALKAAHKMPLAAIRNE